MGLTRSGRFRRASFESTTSFFTKLHHWHLNMNGNIRTLFEDTARIAHQPETNWRLQERHHSNGPRHFSSCFISRRYQATFQHGVAAHLAPARLTTWIGLFSQLVLVESPSKAATRGRTRLVRLLHRSTTQEMEDWPFQHLMSSEAPKPQIRLDRFHRR